MNAPNPNQLWNAGKLLVAAELLRRGAHAVPDLGGRRPRNSDFDHTLIRQELVASGKDAWEMLGVTGRR